VSNVESRHSPFALRRNRELDSNASRGLTRISPIGLRRVDRGRRRLLVELETAHRARSPSAKRTTYLSPAFQCWENAITPRVPPGTPYGPSVVRYITETAMSEATRSIYVPHTCMGARSRCVQHQGEGPSHIRRERIVPVYHGRRQGEEADLARRRRKSPESV